MPISERTPLLQASASIYGQAEVVPSAPVDHGSMSTAYYPNLSDIHEPPPPYVASTKLPPFKKCDICDTDIDITDKQDKHVVQCNMCREHSALKPAPNGKKYHRCTCNCLLIVQDSAVKFDCTRCKRKININRSLSGGSGSSHQYRIICGHCHGTFVLDYIPRQRVQCPLCSKKTCLGERYAKRNAIMYMTIGTACVIGVMVLMAFSIGYRHNAGYWYIYLILLIVATFCFIRGFWFLCMKSSVLELNA